MTKSTVFTPEPHDLQSAFWAGRVGAKFHDAHRIEFVGSDYTPTDEWTETTVIVEDKRLIKHTHVVETRRSSCGSGCRCAAEFRVVLDAWTGEKLTRGESK
jgi:hypothetical protein